MSSDLTPNLGLPYLAAAQSQKHVTHNEAIRALDALVQLSVRSRALASPAAAPQDGERWIVGTPASGTWSGHENAVAAFQDGAWIFLPPGLGWLAWVSDEGRLVAFDGAHWIDAGGGPVPSINPAPLVGINATADATNRLAVKSDASLFDNAGHGHQVKLNKAAPSDTASLLFQDAYAGRAEVGLCGDDNLHIKVSTDGSAWKDAIQIDGATGAVSLPFTTLAASYTLPAATVTDLGGVKQGSNVQIAADGTLTIPPTAFDASGAAAAAQAIATQRSNHTGTQPATSITGLAAVATSGSYTDLSAKPTLGTAAALNAGTAANNVVQLTAAGKLPAVDGSQLTNLPSASGIASFVAPSASTVPATITAVSGQTANLLEIYTPGISPPGARSYFDKYGSFATQAWMTISGLYVDSNGDGTGSIVNVVYPGGSNNSPTYYVGNRINGYPGGMLGISNDTVGPNLLLQDNISWTGANVAVRATVPFAGIGAGYVVGDVLTVSGGTFTAATSTFFDGILPTVRGTGYTVGDVLSIVGGVGTAATITVASIGAGGKIISATLTSAGSYTELPPVNCPLTGGTGTGAYCNMIWPSKGVAKVKVTAVSGGVITGLVVVRPGLYTALPSNPVTLTGGSGTGAAATIAWSTKAQTSRHIEALDYTRTITNVLGHDGVLTFGKAQDIDLFWQSKANLYWVDNDTLGTDATFRPAGLSIAGPAQFGSSGIRQTLTRALPSAAANTVDIGTIKLNPTGAGTTACFAIVTLSTPSAWRRWSVPIVWQGARYVDGGTVYGVGWGNWAVVEPTFDVLQTGSPWELDFSQNTATGDVSLRLRATGSGAATGVIDFEIIGQQLPGRFVESVATATGVAVPTDIVSSSARNRRPRYRTQYFDGGTTDNHFAAPVNAGTVVCSSGYGGCVLMPASALSTLTVQLPSNPYADDDYEVILYGNGITTITFSMSGGAVYGNTISSAAAYSSWKFKFDKEHSRWIRKNA